MNKCLASLSLDLDNLWSYLKIHGDTRWKEYPSYFDLFIPVILSFLKEHDVKITFFIVGQDAKQEASKHWLARIAEDGHESGNHSLHHEPWMDEKQIDEIIKELAEADRAIESAFGKAPVGFRGPGFCCNRNLLESVHRLHYSFDASLFPTVISPLARFYYMLTTKSLKSSEKSQRKNLFGKMKNGFLPIKPFKWELSTGTLLEIPVTTMPMLRLPFHLSYIIWLSKFSKKGALAYFNGALSLCQALKVEPSVLLHPLDFLGKEDVKELSFFPGMDLSREHKLDIAHKAIANLTYRFRVIPMSCHAQEILSKMK